MNMPPFQFVSACTWIDIVYAGCISGALQMQDYLDLVHQAGFVNISVQKKKTIVVPDDLLQRHLTPDQVLEFQASGTGIFSITVYAEKPTTSSPTTEAV